MKFTTEVPVSKSADPIDYGSNIISIGSCFAVNIAQKFAYYQFRHTVNPFGILFHPMAIEKLVRMAVDETHVDENNIFHHNDLWHSFDAHSDCSAFDSAQMTRNLNNSLSDFRQNIKTATHVVITLGTAWVYRHVESGQLVANCHKLPQKNFVKELLDVESIARSIDKIVSLLSGVNPKIAVVFTVSPVRHIKDGFVENQRSKANLISAVHNVLEKRNAHYFPSYEIMMDELRDYRFYAEDMLHPSAVAIDHIWERFVSAWISDSATSVMDEVAAIRRNRAHRAFHPDSESHRAFVAATDARQNALTERFPHMNFST